MSFAELPHIMIGFQNGTGGNFVGHVLAALQSGVLAEIPLTPEGSGHFRGGQYKIIQWASHPVLVIPGESEDDSKLRQLKYCARFIEPVTDLTSPAVILTHERAALASYKELLPNTTQLTITMANDEDVLVAGINFARKWFLPESTGPYQFMRDRWKILSYYQIAAYSGREAIAEIITNDFTDPRHIEILLYFHGVRMVKNQMCCDPIIGPPKCPSIELPFYCIRENDIEAFLKIIEQVFGSDLNDEQLSFVRREFGRYQALQIRELMVDPHEYIRTLGTKTDAYIKELVESIPNK